MRSIPEGLAVFGNEAMLQTILRNLVGNALKFSPASGRVSVTADGTDTGIFLEVRDNGIGMDAELLSRLFKHGLNVKRPGTAGEKGTGLGLLLCDAFVRRRGGRIGVESEPGKGSRFRVILP